MWGYLVRYPGIGSLPLRKPVEFPVTLSWADAVAAAIFRGLRCAVMHK